MLSPSMLWWLATGKVLGLLMGKVRKKGQTQHRTRREGKAMSYNIFKYWKILNTVFTTSLPSPPVLPPESSVTQYWDIGKDITSHIEKLWFNSKKPWKIYNRFLWKIQKERCYIDCLSFPASVLAPPILKNVHVEYIERPWLWKASGVQ